MGGRALPSLLAAIVVAACSSSAGGGPTPAALTARADSQIARGDTVAALATLDTAVRRSHRDAAAWHRLGMLTWDRLRAGGHVSLMQSRDRILMMRLVDSSLRMAAYLAPDSGRFALDLGRYFLFANLITLRAQAPHQFGKALTAAQKAGDRPLESEVADELGMVSWRNYETVAHRWQLTGGASISPGDLLKTRTSAANFLENFAHPTSPAPGELDYTKAADSFAEALAADPGNARAARHRFMALAEQDRWEELAIATGARIAIAPDDANAWFARGLAALRGGQTPQAAAAFDSALARSTSADRRRLTRLGRVLTLSDSARIAALPDSMRGEAERLYWATSDPMTLTPENEHRLEFLARVAFAELRWTSEDFNYHGADTDRGEIYVRYGPPPIIAAFGPTADPVEHCPTTDDSNGGCRQESDVGAGTIIWRYPVENLVFAFSAPPTYGTAGFFEDYRNVAEDARRAAPVSWSNVPIDKAMDTVQVQPARFRAAGDSTDLVLYADVPIHRMVRGIDLRRGTIDVALSIYDHRLHLISRDSTRQTVDFVHPDAAERIARRIRMPAGSWEYRIEALQPEADRGARALATIHTGDAHGFGLSDVVVADTLSPRPDRAPERWSDLLVKPNAGVLRRRSLGLFWETYGLGADQGASRYTVEVTLTVVAVARPNSFGARVIGGIADAMGLSAKGDDRVSLRYDRRRDAGPAVLDWLVISMGDTPPPAGTYRLTVTVTDRVTGQVAAAERVLEIAP